MKSSKWLIYGANGFSASLIIERALRDGIAPILGGRNYLSLDIVGRKYGLETRCFGLENAEETATNLRGITAVLHCAGPFSQTAIPMLEACIRAKVNYLDITGEWKIFRAIFELQKQCRDAEITAIPGVGFDVVATDCLAAKAKELLPSATILRLAFAGVGSKLSRGTTKTIVENLAHDGCIRRNGELQAIPSLSRSRRVNFGPKSFTCYAIPWGDIVTAYESTKIPNIEVYTYVPRTAVAATRTLHFVARKWLQHDVMQDFMMQAVNYFVAGPKAEQREQAYFLLWAEAEDTEGRRVHIAGRTLEGYNFTAEAAVRCVEAIVSGQVRKGVLTPSQAFGSGFIDSLPGTTVQQLI